mmetsp:Transcript_87813/g.250027  ORF Transcript_87813/g.250027 Transcript_87813/m.250027 type:complete len:247 (-) Transcript_87813:2397-3137(-)
MTESERQISIVVMMAKKTRRFLRSLLGTSRFSNLRSRGGGALWMSIKWPSFASVFALSDLLTCRFSMAFTPTVVSNVTNALIVSTPSPWPGLPNLAFMSRSWAEIAFLMRSISSLRPARVSLRYMTLPLSTPIELTWRINIRVCLSPCCTPLLVAPTPDCKPCIPPLCMASKDMFLASACVPSAISLFILEPDLMAVAKPPPTVDPRRIEEGSLALLASVDPAAPRPVTAPCRPPVAMDVAEFRAC